MDIRELRLDEMARITGGALDQSNWDPTDAAAYHRVIRNYADAVKAHDQDWMNRAWSEMEEVLLPLREKYGF